MKNKIAYEDYNLSLKVVSQVLEQNFQKDSQKVEVERENCSSMTGCT